MGKNKKYEKVKRYYDDGLWSISRVADAVTKGWITVEEYEEITNNNGVAEGEDGVI